jgi:hypothetical protein
MSNTLEIGHGLKLNFTREAAKTLPSDIWIWFTGSDGKSAGISVAALAEKTGTIIGEGLRSWASDRINDHMAAKIAAEDGAREREDNSQFGVGA